MNIKLFIDNLKRDKARGNLAPHQIILLISLYQSHTKHKSNYINITELITYFDQAWEENNDKFKSKNCNPGMPIKAFINNEYLDVSMTEEINFRNRNELESKILDIKITPLLINLFKQEGIYKYLISRIDR